MIPVDGIPPLTSGRPPLSEERQSFWNGGAMRSSLRTVLSSPPCPALSTANVFHPQQPGLLRQGLRARDHSCARRSFPVKGARGPFGPGSPSSRLDGCFLRGSSGYPWSHQLSPFLGPGAGVLRRWLLALGHLVPWPLRPPAALGTHRTCFPGPRSSGAFPGHGAPLSTPAGETLRGGAGPARSQDSCLAVAVAPSPVVPTLS